MKTEAHQEAIRLRRDERKSFNEITDLLGVSKGTLSGWLKDYPLSPEESAARRSSAGRLLNQRRRQKFEEVGYPFDIPQVTKNPRQTIKRAPKQVGEISEAIVAARLMKLGFNLLKPIGDSLRYDLMIDFEDSFYRVQVKTARVENGVIDFSTVSSQAHRGKGKQSYKGQIEWFAACVQETEEVYMVHIDNPIAKGQEVTLRISRSMTTPTAENRIAIKYILNDVWTPINH